MKTHKFITLLLVFMSLVACQKESVIKQQKQTSFSNWQLDVTESQFSFITVKNKTHTEENSIEFKDGLIDENGQMTLRLDLSSVDTLIELRDKRLREILFEVDAYPVATVSADIDPSLPFEQSTEVEFELNLHGISKTMQATIMIQQVNNQLIVINYEPVVVNAKDFDLDQGINQLTKIAGLQSINYEVLVDFKLVFEK